MFKKMLAILLSTSMILGLGVPVYAAQEDTDVTQNAETQRPMEEILNRYHAKSFELSFSNGNSSRSVQTSETIKQDTINELQDAGYEVYDVNPSTYADLEEQLNTDFGEMGLAPDDSYIVVISGENGSQETYLQHRWGPDISVENDDFGGTSTFSYVYNGTTYTMRYVTITNADVPDELFVSESYQLSNIQYLDDIADVLGDFLVAAVGEKIVEELLEKSGEYIKESTKLIPFVGDICTVTSLLVDVADAAFQNPLALVDPGTLMFRAGAAWTRSYIQVYDKGIGQWVTTQCSSYAVTHAHFDAAYVYDSATNAPKQVGDILRDDTVYSPYYNDAGQRKLRAVQGYLGNCPLFDYTGDIDICFINPNSTGSDEDKIFLFSLQENHAELLPSMP